MHFFDRSGISKIPEYMAFERNTHSHCCGSLLWYAAKNSKKSRRKEPGSAFLLGMLHMQKEENFRNRYLSKVEDDSYAVVWGEIKKVEQTEYSFRLILSDCYISLNEEVMPCNDVMVYTSSNHFHVGEIHKIIGKINRFSKARNEGNFDSRMYYESQKIDLSMQEETSVLLDKNVCWIRDGLLSLKARWQQVYDYCMEEKSAGFYTAMVLGDRNGLEAELKDLFQIGGISHILAISGLHVSILGRNVYNWLRKCRGSFRFSGIVAGVLLIGYCYMVGYGMSAVRAVGMMLLFFLSQYIGRSYDMLNALGAVCMLLLWENPFLIEYSGFWLSVTALFGTCLVRNGFAIRKVDSECKKDVAEKRNNLATELGGGLGISLTTLPVVALCFYEIPLYAILVNAVVLPLLPFIFGLAVIGGIIGIYVPALAEIILRPCASILHLYEVICEWVAKLPCASIITGAPSVAQVVLYYLVLLFGVGWLDKKYRCKENVEKQKINGKGESNKGGNRWNIISRQIALTIVCFGILIFPKYKPFEITFLDVGQGDGIYISTGDGITYFIDGGSLNVSGLGTYRILPFLKYKDVRAIDYWFVSHADTDHISGLLEVLESGYEIRYLVLSAGIPRDENYEMLIETVETCDTKIVYMDAGERIATDNTTMTCLYPCAAEYEEGNLGIESSKLDRNELSMVLFFENNGLDSGMCISALFSGDCSSETEEEWIEQVASMLEQSDIDIRLFKAGHHGSNYSNGKMLLDVLQPKYAVVSCSETNRYGHPGKGAVERMEESGAKIFYTMKYGQIKVRVNKGRVEIDEFK